jgi:hypothetical protein
MSGSQTVTWTFSPGLSPTACYIDTAGIHAPPFQDILTYLQTQMQGIFGSDIYLSNDSQDGQMLGIFATAIYDTNSMAIATYNAFSPNTAQGIGLSSVVKINGISRRLPTNSTVAVTLGGTVGTTILNGVVADTSNNKWALPSSVIIPSSGAITVTATCQTAGAVTAGPGIVNIISSPTFGWQTVTNAEAAAPGLPLESDSVLRVRQTQSTMLPSVTALDGMAGAVASIVSVNRFAVYENDTNITDSNGLPGHSVSFVIQGGDVQSIVNAIALHKTPGAYTYGNTSGVVVDAYGVPHTINYFTVTPVQITTTIHLTPLQGYTSSIGIEVANAVVAYINTIPIGQNVYLNRVVSIANLPGMPDGKTFNVSSVVMSRGGGTPAAQDIVIAFNETAVTDTTASGVTIAVP